MFHLLLLSFLTLFVALFYHINILRHGTSVFIFLWTNARIILTVYFNKNEETSSGASGIERRKCESMWVEKKVGDYVADYLK